MKQVKPALSALSQVSKSLANTEHVPNPYALNSEVIASIETWSGLVKQASDAGDRLVDVLVANGVKPYHFVDFSEKDDKQGASFRDNVFSHIVSGWADKVAQKLVFADPKTLSTSEQAQRTVLVRMAQKQYHNLKAQLGRRLENANATKASPANKKVLALRAVKQAIKYLQDEKNGYDNMPEDLKALQGLKIHSKVIDPKASKASK